MWLDGGTYSVRYGIPSVAVGFVNGGRPGGEGRNKGYDGVTKDCPPLARSHCSPEALIRIHCYLLIGFW
jgi:hypothetical protein